MDMHICWHLYPLGFTAAPVRPTPEERHLTHRLGHIERWLDYAAGMHANTLQLGPIFTSETHGYDTLDHFSIDPRLGTLNDIDSLVAAAHTRGLGVVLDGVFNHVASAHPLAQAGHTSGTVFEGHKDLVELDHESPQVIEYIAEVMNFWLDRGITGWRLDAAYAVAPETWARVLPKVRERHPDAWFVGEMIHGDYNEYVAASGLDSVTQYELWKAIWSSLKDGNFYELDWCLQRNNDLNFAPMTFVGNHDVTRIATTLSDRQAMFALLILCTVSGEPSIYYGDEQVFRGEKEERHGGDDAVRPAFPEGPGLLAPDGQWMYELHRKLLGFRAERPWLAQAKTYPLHLANTQYTYEVHGPAGERLKVSIDMDADTAAIEEHGHQVLSI